MQKVLQLRNCETIPVHSPMGGPDKPGHDVLKIIQQVD